MGPSIISLPKSLEVGDNIGSGSYGTVHLLHSKKGEWFVGKRPWSLQELEERSSVTSSQQGNSISASGSQKKNDPKFGSKGKSPKDPMDRAARCLYYWKVEAHCFAKLPPHPQLPPYIGVQDQTDWMVFGFVGESSGDGTASMPKPAPTLQDLMNLDCKMGKQNTLQNIASAFQIKQNEEDAVSTYAETLDTVIPSLLSVLAHVHESRIVHRDVKPSNLLVHNRTLLLMDFGSAADLDPSTGIDGVGIQSLLQSKRRVGLEDNSRVAVSPIYAAPEVFISLLDSPTAFDIFSAALIYCQLLLGYLEERVDAGFHQQLRDADWDLNVWLNNELGTRLRPVGLDQALEYLAERPGLWTLLSDMLCVDPNRRPTAKQALKRWNEIRRRRDDPSQASIDDKDLKTNQDHPFFEMVLEALETCEIPSISRPLHFVATFSRSQSLGLVLSEGNVDDNDDEMDLSRAPELWAEATSDAIPGEVFVKEILPHSQADELGILEVGDRLSGIGELPFISGGFEKALSMIQDQPKHAQNIRLHFDRKSVRKNEAIDINPTKQVAIEIVDVGAWSSKGRRKTQEDAFVLHEIHDAKDRSVLVAGVMDGHGGTAASTMVSKELPGLLTNGLVVQNRQRSVAAALEDSWQAVCKTYQHACDDEGLECVADYDPQEGVLQAETGSVDLAAGTTCSVVALDETTSQLAILNCGDSRSLVASSKGKLRFATADHTPQAEEIRLMEGIVNGLDYSPPQCRLSRWWLKVGDYEYAVARSLEGPFATSKGIICDADISTLSVTSGDILLSASDGLFDVMDSDEVALELHRMRQAKLSARDAARTLCTMAVRKGSPDNVSVVLVFL